MKTARPSVDLNKVSNLLSKKLKKVSLTSILIIILIIAAYFIGSLKAEVKYLKKGSGTEISSNTQAAPAPNAAAAPNALGAQPAGDVKPVSDSDHIRGNKNAKVVLIEYSDLECPFCKSFHPTMKKVLSEYGNDVAWVYRHYPLTSIHPDAQKAAEASECVADLGGEDAFWKFVDAVFDPSAPTDVLSDSGLAKVAGSVGVNTGSFTSCLNNGSKKSIVDADQSGGTTAGVTGTPTSFIISKNGDPKMIPGALPYEQIKASIDAALAN